MISPNGHLKTRIGSLTGEFLHSWRSYNGDKLRHDSLAAVTVAFVALPQSMAYALIAGIPPQFGLYAFIVGSVVGSLFGASRHLQTGPTNASSIVIASALAVSADPHQIMGSVFLLSFLAGAFQLGAGLLKLGNLTHFISRSVLVGFMAAAGMLIAVGQIPNFLGLPSHGHVSIVDSVQRVFIHIAELQPISLTLGLTTIIVAFLIARFSPKSERGLPLLPPYLIAMLAAAVIVWWLDLENLGVHVIGRIPATLPPLSAPDFGWDQIQSLTTGAFALGIIGLAEAFSSAKAVVSFSGDRLDANKEFIGQGLAKIAVSFFSGMPVSGSPSRTLLNFRAGAVTRASNLLASMVMIIVVLVFSPITQYIPVAALAGILLMIATQMVNWKHAAIAIRATRSDAAAMLVTFIAALFLPLSDAIYIGVGVSLVLFLRKAQTPRLTELVYDENIGFQTFADSKRPIPEISIVHIEGDVFFGSADYLEEEIQRIARRDEIEVLILRLKGACCMDATSILTLMKVHEEMKKHGKLLLISGATGDVERIFRRSRIDRVIGEENIFFSDTTILKSTATALGKALDHVNKKGGKQYRVRLLFDRPQAGLGQTASATTEPLATA